MSDETPTPRHTPLISSAPVLAVLARDWASRLTAAADEAKRLRLWNRMRKCEAIAMRMRALALEFTRLADQDPGPDARRDISARWIDAQVEARELKIPAGEYGS
jgi:hypothetical protein